MESTIHRVGDALTVNKGHNQAKSGSARQEVTFVRKSFLLPDDKNGHPICLRLGRDMDNVRCFGALIVHWPSRSRRKRNT